MVSTIINIAGHYGSDNPMWVTAHLEDDKKIKIIWLAKGELQLTV